MKKILMNGNCLFLTLLFLFFTGCSENIIPDIQKKLAGSDEVKIYFYDEGIATVTDPDKIVTIGQKQVIDAIVSSFTEEDAPGYKCGYNGTIEFFENKKIILVAEFNFEKDCSHFLFRHNKKMFSKRISDKGSELLRDYYSRTFFKTNLISK